MSKNKMTQKPRDFHCGKFFKKLFNLPPVKTSL